MTDTTLLKELIREKGIKCNFLADKMGISYVSFYRKVNNKRYFNSYEIQSLCDLLDINDLRLKDNIFFAN